MLAGASPRPQFRMFPEVNLAELPLTLASLPIEGTPTTTDALALGRRIRQLEERLAEAEQRDAAPQGRSKSGAERAGREQGLKRIAQQFFD